jgi:hypothetical protein
MRESAHRWTFFVLAAATIVFSALSPWIRTRLRFPDDSFDVSVIYRSHVGDIQYYPLIAELSRGSFTDETIKELKGTQILSFPTASMLPHALAFALFGAPGFMVADVVVAILYFSCVVAFFRVLGASWSASTIGSLFVSLSIPLELSILADLGPLVTKLPILTRLWGLRIPRPFVSELFIVLSFVVSLRIMASNDRGRTAHWVAIAAAYALLLQSDLHAAMIFAFASPFLLYGIVKQRGVSQTLYGVVWAGLLFTILASHFVLSRLTENPEIPIRWGVFALNRLGGFDRNWLRHLPQVCLTILSVYFTARLFDQNAPKSPLESTHPLRRTMPYVLVLLLAAFFAKPLSILILGKTVQPYHFDDRMSRICTYFLVGVVLLWVDWGIQRFARRSSFIQNRLGTATACLQAASLAVACAYVFLITFLYSGGRVDTAHLRSAYYIHTAESQPNYRRNFTELAAYLDKNVKPDAVIATFDHEVYSWWMTFHEGYSYLVEPFVSSASDEELESRLAALCRLLGMSTEQYLKFIQNDYVNTFFLGCAKYQASAWRRYSTLDDYTDEQKQTFLKSRDVWNVAIPQSELRRLKTSYEASEAPGAERELDVIVLSNFGPEKELAPPAENWTPAFENNAFRVYRARRIETRASPR